MQHAMHCVCVNLRKPVDIYFVEDLRNGCFCKEVDMVEIKIQNYCPLWDYVLAGYHSRSTIVVEVFDTIHNDNLLRQINYNHKWNIKTKQSEFPLNINYRSDDLIKFLVIFQVQTFQIF